MFHESESVEGCFFTEIESVRGSVPECGRCGKPLSKKLATEHFYDNTRSIISFWAIRCPECRAGHVIFNSTTALPPAPPTPGPAMPPAPPDPAQPSLL